MKKLLALASAASLAVSLSFAIPSVAAADTAGTGNSGLAAFCQVYAASFGVTQGNCVTGVRALLAGNPPNANSVCHFLQSLNPAEFAATFPNFGACTSAYNSIY